MNRNKKLVNERIKITVIGCGACGSGVTEEIENKIRDAAKGKVEEVVEEE